MKNDGAPIRETLSEAAPILTKYLGAAGVEDLRAFVETRLDDGKPTAMVYGIYNSGKSTLLNALCGRELARVANRPETDRVTPYVWEGTEILDTPGIDAPQEHEKVSREALERTDAVLFVMDSSSTFEEAAVYDEIVGILERGKRLMVVVNNKGGLSRADRDYIRVCDKIQENTDAAAVRRSLPPGRAALPIRMADARTGLRGRLESKPKLVYASGLADLEADLKRMLAAAGFHDVVNTVGRRLLDDLGRALVKASPGGAGGGPLRRIDDDATGPNDEKSRVESALSQERRRAVAQFRKRANGAFDNRQPDDLHGACVEFCDAVARAVESELAAARKNIPELGAPAIDGSGAMESAAGEIAAGAPRETGAGGADAGPDVSGEAVTGAAMTVAKVLKIPGRFAPLVGPAVEIGLAVWRHYSERTREREAKEEMQRFAQRWTDHVAESADRLNDAAKEVVHRSVDAAFAPVEARQRAERERLEEEARAIAEDRATLDVCRDRVERHLEAMRPAPPAA